MAFGRRQHNLTVLADGTVLATGGNSSGAGLVDLNAGVYAAEQWNPATGQWRTLAAECRSRASTTRPRCCCPTAVSSPPAAGSAARATRSATSAKNAQIFSPPYLFQADGTLAPRPAIDSAPAATSYGAAMEIATANPASIQKVALVRLGAVTHSNNMEQRYIPLSFTAGADEPHGHRTGQRQHRAAGLLHALHHRRQRRAVGCPHGHRPGQLPADRDAHAAEPTARPSRRPPTVNLAATRFGRRRHRHQGRVLQRRDEARRGHDRAVQLHLERRGGRNLLAHRSRDRRPRRRHHEPGLHDHRQLQQRRADRDAHRSRATARPSRRPPP